MRPHRVLVALGISAIALILALSPCLDRSIARADRSTPQPAACDVPPSETAVPRAGSGLLIVLAAPEKERVEKKKEKPPAPPAPPTPVSSTSTSESDDEGFFESCASGCLEGCMEGLVEGFIFSLFHRHAPDSVTTFEPHDWKVTERGWLRAGTPGDSVALYLEPLGLDSQDVEVGRLPEVSELLVLEIHTLPGGIELRVHPVDRVEPLGWIASGSLTATPPGAAAVPARAVADSGPARPSASSGPPRPRGQWAGAIAVGGGGMLAELLADEYEDGGLHLEARAVHISAKGLVLGVGLGSWGLSGNPEVVYQAATEIDEPSHSRLRMYSLGVSVGTRDGRGPTNWFFGIGPALFYVHERAHVRTFSVGGTPTLLGTREESLGRFAGGGILRTGGAWRTPSRLELGLQISGYGMAWTGRREKSLTTDFVNGGIYGADVALVLTYPAP